MNQKTGTGKRGDHPLDPLLLRREIRSGSPSGRAIYCALLVSLGALCSGMILLRTDPGLRPELAERAVQLFRSAPPLWRLLLFFGFPLAAVLSGFALLGPFLLTALDLCFGAAVCLYFSAPLLASAAFPWFLLLCLPAAVLVVYLSDAVLHLDGMLLRQLCSGGRFRPDLRPVFLRIAVFSVLYELTAYFLWMLF